MRDAARKLQNRKVLFDAEQVSAECSDNSVERRRSGPATPMNLPAGSVAYRHGEDTLSSGPPLRADSREPAR